MKKTVYLLLLCILSCAFSAAAYDVYLYTDDGSNVKCKDGGIWIGGTSHSINSGKGFTHFSASNNNLMVRGTSNNSTFKAVKCNTTNVSKSGNGNGLSPNSYNADLNGKESPILVEVYNNTTTAFSYPLGIIISGEKSKVESIKVGNTSYNVSDFEDNNGNPKTVNFTYGQQVVVTLSKAASSYSTESGRSVSVNSSTHTYTFTPCPVPAGEKLILDIPSDNFFFSFSADNSSRLIACEVDGTTYTDFNEAVPMTLGQSFTIYTKYAPITNSLNLTFSPATYNGQSCYSVTYKPQQGGELYMTFSDSHFTAQVNDDNLSECLGYIFGYQVMHDNDPNQVDDLPEFSEIYGSCRSTFGAGDKYILYLSVLPNAEEGYVRLGQNTVLTPETTTFNGETVYKYVFTPIDEEYLTIRFGDVSGNGNTGGGSTNVETFKVYLKPDRAGVVQYRRSDEGDDAWTVINDVMNYTEAIAPTDGSLIVGLVDNVRYAFTRFVDTDETGTAADFLDYDIQRSNVSISPSRGGSLDTSGGIIGGSSGGIQTENDRFTIETKDFNDEPTYNIIVEVDDVSNVVLEAGTQAARSTSNLKKNLVNGRNDVTLYEIDTNVYVYSKETKNLHGVTFDGNDIEGAPASAKVFTIPVTKATANGKTIEIQANKPAGNLTFTANITGLDQITGFYQKYLEIMGYDDETGEPITMPNSTSILSRLHEGENTIHFSEGDYFEVTYDVNKTVANSCQYAGTDLEYGYAYQFTPAQGGVFSINLSEKPRRHFTVLTDKPERVSAIQNWDTDETTAITEQITSVPFDIDGEEMRFTCTTDPDYVKFDGVILSPINSQYSFRAHDGKDLEIVFERPVVKPNPTFKVIVDDASQIISLDDDETEVSYPITNGENIIEITPESDGFTLYVDAQATLVTLDGVEVSYTKKGKYYEFTPSEGSVLNVIYAITPSFTFIVDDPSKINFDDTSDIFNGAVMGSNSYEYEGSPVFNIATTSTPLSFTINGTDADITSFTPGNGSVVKLFFNHVPEGNDLKKVVTTFVNEGTEGVINWVYIGDDYTESYGPFLVDANAEMNYNFKNHSYHFNSITVNGEAQNTANGAFTFRALADTEVAFDVYAPTAINYTINANNPADVIISYNDASQTEIVLIDEENANATSFAQLTNSLNKVITIARNPEAEVTMTVKQNNEDVEINQYGAYVITLADGDVIDIVTTPVVWDKTFVVALSIDINGNEALAGLPMSGTLTAINSKRQIQLYDPEDPTKTHFEIPFNSEYDGGFTYGFGAEIPTGMFSYIEDEEIYPSEAYMGMFYEIHPENADIVRTYYTYLEPEEVFTGMGEDEFGNPKENYELVYPEPQAPTKHEVKFWFFIPDGNGVDQDNFTVLRENVKDVVVKDEKTLEDCTGLALDQKVSKEWPGTMYYIIAPYNRLEVEVEILPEEENGDSEVEPSAAKRRLGQNLVTREDFDANDLSGNGGGLPTHTRYYFPVKGNEIVMAYPTTLTGVEDVVSGNQDSHNIYNIQGMLIKADATPADLKTLPAGFYIFNGKKHLVK